MPKKSTGDGQPKAGYLAGETARTDDVTGIKKKNTGNAQVGPHSGYALNDGDVQSQARNYGSGASMNQAKESGSGKKLKHGRMV